MMGWGPHHRRAEKAPTGARDRLLKPKSQHLAVRPAKLPRGALLGPICTICATFWRKSAHFFIGPPHPPWAVAPQAERVRRDEAEDQDRPERRSCSSGRHTVNWRLKSLTLHSNVRALHAQRSMHTLATSAQRLVGGNAPHSTVNEIVVAFNEAMVLSCIALNER